MTPVEPSDDDRDIIGNDTPADPALQAAPAMIETTIQPARATQVADTAFDAVAPNLGQASRSAIALIGAIVLAVIAGLLAYQADQKNPAPAQRAAAARGE